MKVIMENWKKFIREDDQDSEEVAKLVLVNSNNEVLFLKRSNYVDKFAGEWDLPGGHIKVGESLKDGLIREVEEETGLKILRVRLFTRIENLSFFEAVYEKGNIALSNEHVDHAFIDPVSFDNPDKFQKIAQEVLEND